MILSKPTVDMILEAANLATILKIEGIIFDEAGIRGYNDDDGILIIATDDFKFEFESMGLTRLPALKHKFGLLKALEKYTVEAVTRPTNPDIIEKLFFDGGRVNFEFRAAHATSILDLSDDLLQKMKLTPRFYFDVTDEDVKTITQGMSSMRSKTMTLSGDTSQIRFRFSDDTGDILNFNVDSSLSVNVGDDEDENIMLVLTLQKVVPILRLAAQGGKFRLNILKNDIIHVTINNMNVLIMPEV